MILLYKCACMAEEAEVDAPDRQPDEDVRYWLEVVAGSAILLDHRTRSPRCKRTVTEYVKLSMPENAPGIGMKPRLDS